MKYPYSIGEMMDEKDFLESLNIILIIMREQSIELNVDIALFARGNTSFMKDMAVEGVFTPCMPFYVSTRLDFQEELPYLNILLMDEGKKLMYIESIKDDYYDALIAPESEFELVEELDEFTIVWKCINQPFYDE